MDRSQPEDIAVGVMKIAETYLRRIIRKQLPSLLACYQGTRHTIFGEQKSMKQKKY